ncbi:hypothetical protein C3L95_002348 [Salmonella enterica subsp. enterica serovar Saintpaul]|nr:hypothetical protein [Salmonella enterica subsp. enterica serovar Saintpaul]
MTQSRRPSPLQRRVLIVLAALDEKRPGPVLTRDLERVLERSGEAPVYGPNLRASCRRLEGTVAKLAMRQPFVLFKGLTFQKLCLPGAFRPGDHHNKMLRPGLCVVHASPQYL